jgi:hypothetical protein
VRRRRLAVLVIAVFVLAAVAVLAVVAYDRWSCPSQAELERPRPAEEVVVAFEDRGVTLAPTTLPEAVVRGDAAYRGATAYRLFTERAGLFVLVCKARCANAPQGLREEPIATTAGRPRQDIRQFSTLGNNIAIFVTDNDGRSGQRLQARVQPVLDELDAAVPIDSHCYVQ